MSDQAGNTRDVTFQLAVKTHDEAAGNFKRFQDAFQTAYDAIDQIALSSIEKRHRAELDKLAELKKGSITAFDGLAQMMQKATQESLEQMRAGHERMMAQMRSSIPTTQPTSSGGGAALHSPAGQSPPGSLRLPSLSQDTLAAASAVKQVDTSFRAANQSATILKDDLRSIRDETRAWMEQLAKMPNQMAAAEEMQRRILQYADNPDALLVVKDQMESSTREIMERRQQEAARHAEQAKQQRATQAGLQPGKAGYDQFIGESDKKQEEVLRNQLAMRARFADHARKTREQDARDEAKWLAEREASWEKTETAIQQTREQSAMRQRHIDDQLSERLIGIAGYAAQTVRGFALLGLAGEENSQKLVEGLTKAQAAFDLFQGGARLVLSVKKAFDLYNDAMTVGQKLKEADQRAADLSREKADALAGALGREAAEANRAAQAHDRLSRSRRQSSSAGNRGSGGAVGFAFEGLGAMAGGGVPSRGRGRRGAAGGVLGTAAEYGASYLASNMDGPEGEAMGFVSSAAPSVLDMLSSKAGRAFTSRGLQVAGRAAPYVAAIAGTAAATVSGYSSATNAANYGIGAGAEKGSIADRIGSAEVSAFSKINDWTSRLGGLNKIDKMTGGLGSGWMFGAANLVPTGGQAFGDTLDQLAAQKAMAKRTGLEVFSKQAEATQSAERKKSPQQIAAEIRQRQEELERANEEERQQREQEAERRLVDRNRVSGRRDDYLSTRMQLGSELGVDNAMAGRRREDSAADTQVRELTQAIKALESQGGNAATLGRLQRQLSGVTQSQWTAESGRLSEGLTRDLAQSGNAQQMAQFQRREALQEGVALRQRRMVNPDSVTDAEIRDADERAVAAAEKLNALARNRVDLERRAGEERRQAGERAVEAMRRELEMVRDSIRQQKAALDDAKVRFGEMSEGDQRKAMDLAGKLKRERDSLTTTGQTTGERQRGDEVLQSFADVSQERRAAEARLAEIEGNRQARQESPGRLKSLREQLEAQKAAGQDTSQTEAELKATREASDAAFRSPDRRLKDEDIDAQRRKVQELREREAGLQKRATSVLGQRREATIQAQQNWMAGEADSFRRRNGMVTSSLADEWKDKREQETRDRLAGTLTDDERRTAQTTGTQEEADLARRSARQRANRMGFETSFGRDERDKIQNDESRAKQLSVQVDNASWKVDVNLSANAQETARLASDAIRPMLDQFRTELQEAMLKSLTANLNAGTTQQRGRAIGAARS